MDDYIPDDFDFSFLYDDDDPSWLDKIKVEIEQLEGFRVEHNELILKVWHYGTEVGACHHLGSYLNITPTLINELAKYDLELERFMCDEDIYYQLIKPKHILHPKIRPDLHLSIQWSKDLHPNYGYINGHYFGYHRNDYHGKYIQLVYRHQIYMSFSCTTPDHIKPYFDKIWQELLDTEYIRHPKEIRIGSKVANYLPDGFKAYKTDDDGQCKVSRSKEKYCYIKRLRDNEYYTSFSINWALHPSEKTSSLTEAVGAALRMIAKMSTKTPLSIKNQ
ncbi:hypothetical protein [Okeania sp. KiyG1]|uniref:hypothetical protein n=1 Tax=Okeania sp. KiyG1 TaxID=2720165 RepID=UPI001922E320|nr:hypothetical protein [Okeania sp. KiyG1]GFZ92302.1 hypothetical protein CYANOKiyG1_02800 [Okeania sp. KiyG1]